MRANKGSFTIYSKRRWHSRNTIMLTLFGPNLSVVLCCPLCNEHLTDCKTEERSCVEIEKTSVTIWTLIEQERLKEEECIAYLHALGSGINMRIMKRKAQIMQAGPAKTTSAQGNHSGNESIIWLPLNSIDVGGNVETEIFFNQWWIEPYTIVFYSFNVYSEKCTIKFPESLT